MGRGRAKAKQTKVARELKYSAPRTDFEALQRELTGDEVASGEQQPERVEEYDDEYGDYRR
jgi:hypothetical protein